MKKARFTEEQVVAILREADKTPLAEVAKKHKISDQTIYNWRVTSVPSSPLTSSAFAASRPRMPSSSASLASAIRRSTRSTRSTAESGELAGRDLSKRVPASCVPASYSKWLGQHLLPGARRARCPSLKR